MLQTAVFVLFAIALALPGLIAVAFSALAEAHHEAHHREPERDRLSLHRQPLSEGTA
jgi:hypothetical protein